MSYGTMHNNTDKNKENRQKQRGNPLCTVRSMHKTANSILKARIHACQTTRLDLATNRRISPTHLSQHILHARETELAPETKIYLDLHRVT